MRRRAGVLLHPSSLPGPYGIGDLGPAARELLGWLESAGQRIWQVLPLNPVDHLGCPYASPSAFAREPLLLSMDDLADDGWLQSAEKPWMGGLPHQVDWDAVISRRRPVLATVADRVRAQVDVTGWAADHPELETCALHQALVGELGYRWPAWPDPLRHRDEAALADARDRHADEIERHLALQWLFDVQWGRLREEARRRDIRIWGDLPIFVGLYSCDVWARPHLWQLDDALAPQVISGVPPDAFSATGQLWGHPLYRVDAHRDEGFAWWIARMAAALDLYDRVRIDHFRGVEAVWESPADATDATSGRWVPSLGAPMLQALQDRWPDMPFLAEDLGVITDEVKALRDDFGLPGMVILQFAFGRDPARPWVGDHPYLPHNHRPEQVCYTGTHDNDTALGWFRSTDDGTRDLVRRYLQVDDRDMPWALLVAAWRSVANTAIVPMQDLLAHGSDARMNVPGTSDGNWSWRMPAEAMNLALAARLEEQVRLSGRLGLAPDDA